MSGSPTRSRPRDRLEEQHHNSTEPDTSRERDGQEQGAPLRVNEVRPRYRDRSRRGRSKSPRTENTPPLDPRLDPVANPDPFTRWVGSHTVAKVLVEGKLTNVLLDTGAQSNLVTPQFVKENRLSIGPLHHLAEKAVTLTGVGGLVATQIVGYTMLDIRVKGVDTYREESIALVVPDESEFAKRVPVILGTCTTGRIIPHIKESEMEGLEEAWEAAKMNEMLSARRTLVEEGFKKLRANVVVNSESSAIVDAKSGQIVGPTPSLLDPGPAPIDIHDRHILKTRHTIDIPRFSSHLVEAEADRMPPAEGDTIRVLVEPLPSEKTPRLHPAVRVQPCYHEVPKGGKRVTLFIVNRTGKDMKIVKGTPVAYVAEVTNIAQTENLKPTNLPEGSTMPRQSHEERLKQVFEMLDLSHLDSWPEAERKKAKDLMAEYADIFALHDLELGQTKGANHKIELEDPTQPPFKERYRHIPKHHMDEVRNMIEEMLRIGVIKESKSPWCNAVVLARKKNGDLRLCIDFRKLNQRTVKDSYPLPRINEALDNIRGARFFTSLDLKQGFWEVPMHPDSQPLTAFTVGPLGFYEFTRMPFGLCNAPATFQRLMESCLGELVLETCLIYVDDIIVFSPTENSHLARLRAVFDRIRDFGLKMRPHKCTFFAREVDYLGHHVSGEGIRPDDGHIARVKEFLPPATVTEVRQFLGFVNHYRRFIKGHSKIARPLQAYTAGENAKEKNQPVHLSPEALEAFEILRNACVEAPVLAFADYTKPFILETDASKEALGAVLSQKQEDGTIRPVAYGSRTTTQGEKNYHSTKLEFLALKWAVSDEFRDYLIVQKFLVKTDNNPLTYIFTTPHLDAVGHRWVQQLAGFNFTIEYVKGRNNGAADALSRLRRGKLEERQTLEADDVKALMNGAMMTPAERAENHRPEMVELDQRMREDESRTPCPWEEIYQEEGTSAVSSADEENSGSTPAEAAENVAVKVIRPLRVQTPEWKVEQFQDPALKEIKDWVVRKESSQDPAKYPTQLLQNALAGLEPADTVKAYMRQVARYRVRQGLLYREGERKEDDSRTPQFVVPRAYRKRAFDGCHRDAGHQGQTRTLSLLQDRFWWPGMVTECREAVKDCARCIQATAPFESAKLCPILVTHPMELVHVDVVHIEKKPADARPGTSRVLVITDHFTRFTQAYIVPDERASTIAKVLWKEFFSVFGAPARLISDQGRAFESELIAQLCATLGVEKVRTSPYHPQGNGSVERANQTLLNMLRKLNLDEKNRWQRHLPTITHAYNCTRSAITGYSPYFLMFGTRPRTSVDLFFPTVREGPSDKNYNRYVHRLRLNLQEAFSEAEAAIAKEAGRQKRYYDSKIRGVVLEQGDIVQLAITGAHERRKIRDRWGDKLYKVVEPGPGGIPVLSIQALDGGRVFKVHRNRLRLLRQGTNCVACKTTLIASPTTLSSDGEQASGEAECEEPGSNSTASTAAGSIPGDTPPGDDEAQIHDEAKTVRKQTALEQAAGVQPNQVTCGQAGDGGGVIPGQDVAQDPNP